MAKYNIRLTDASEGTERAVEIVTDRHGFTVALQGVEENLVLDLDHGQLRVFITNENGDIQDSGQLGVLGASRFSHRYPTTCPHCQGNLCVLNSVVFRYGGKSHAGSCESCLDPSGVLQDVNSVIAQGLHISTSCRHCGASLDDEEIT